MMLSKCWLHNIVTTRHLRGTWGTFSIIIHWMQDLTKRTNNLTRNVSVGVWRHFISFLLVPQIFRSSTSIGSVWFNNVMRSFKIICWTILCETIRFKILMSVSICEVNWWIKIAVSIHTSDITNNLDQSIEIIMLHYELMFSTKISALIKETSHNDYQRCSTFCEDENTICVKTNVHNGYMHLFSIQNQ